jgi:hypothetical protein
VRLQTVMKVKWIVIAFWHVWSLIFDFKNSLMMPFSERNCQATSKWRKLEVTAITTVSDERDKLWHWLDRMLGD